jgi:hypothetical protein
VKNKAVSAIAAGHYTPDEKEADGEFGVYIDEIFSKRKIGRNGKSDSINAAELGKAFEKFLVDNAFDSEDFQKVQAMI